MPLPVLARRHRIATVAAAAAPAGPFAAHFTAASSQSLKNVTNDADWTFGAFDIAACAWVKVDSVPTTSMTILSLWDVAVAGNRPFSLFINNGGTGQARPKFQIMGTTNTNRAGISTQDINDGAWHFVVGWWDHAAGIARIQVDNGTVFASAAAAITMAAIGPSTVPLRMGALTNSGPSLFFDGAEDSVGFWKSAPGGGAALSSGIRTTLYNGGLGLNYSGLTGTEKANLISWWDLEAASGASQTDAHGTTTLVIDTTGSTQVAGKV